MKRILFLIITIFTMVTAAHATLAMHRHRHKHQHQHQHQHRPVRHRVYRRVRTATNLPRTVTSRKITNLTYELNQLVRASGVSADVSIYVRSMQSKKDLFTYYVERSMTPASVLKVLTAESALLFLGPDYRFKTELLSSTNNIQNGVLQGDLYVVLSGDPTLTYYDLIDLLFELKTRKITGISGNVYIDNTAYDKQLYGPGWGQEDKKYCYAAPISASIINHNCLQFQVTPSGAVGQMATVLKSPKFFYPKITNQVVTKGSRSAGRCGLQVTKDNGHITLDGCMARGRYAWGINYVVNDLSDYNLKLFQNLLYRMGVRVNGRIQFGVRDRRLSPMNQHFSAPLSDLIHIMLKKSDNVIAGAVFKKIGQQYTGRQGTWDNGSIAVSRILAQKVGLNAQGLRVLDGSGLSPDNLVKASQIMQVLSFSYSHPGTSQFFVSALPISGVDGTLKHRLKNIARRVRAKTGTISGVASLAGYVRTMGNENLAFVIMINGSKAYGWKYRGLEDSVVTALARYSGSSDAMYADRF